MDFLFYMGDVFTPINFGLLLLGTIGGLILGATPGLSPTMTVALMIPFTFKLEPQQHQHSHDTDEKSLANQTRFHSQH